MVASARNADMPARKGWKKIFINSCASGPHFYFTFNHGTFFYNIDECSSSNTTKTFVDGIIKEQSNKRI